MSLCSKYWANIIWAVSTQIIQWYNIICPQYMTVKMVTQPTPTQESKIDLIPFLKFLGQNTVNSLWVDLKTKNFFSTYSVISHISDIQWRNSLGQGGRGSHREILQTYEICFGSTKMGIFYREKAFHTGKKSGKMTLPPLKNIPLTTLLTSFIWSSF